MGFKWFELVDAAGEAMTRMHYVSVDVPFAAGLRKAVQAEYATTFLAGIAPSELVVYASRAAFDAKREPLEVDPIESLGESPRDPLIVQVPPSNIPTMKRKWFQLVDAAGAALADVDGVNIDSSIVLVLRDAVKAKYAGSSHLVGIVAANLVVYANRAAMDAKQPLKRTDAIDSFGESDEDPLIVQTTASVRAASSSSDSKELIVEAVLEAIDRRDERRSVHSISNLNSELGAQIKTTMHLRDDYLEVDEPVDTSIAGYEWIPGVAEPHESQREGYMSYLQLHLKPLLDRGDFQLDDIAHDKTALSVVDPRLPFRMNGTADVLLVNRRKNVLTAKLAGI